MIGAGQTATGSYIDFSSDFGRDFWKNGVKELLDIGVSGIWNDNNEFSISDDNHCYSINGGTSVSLLLTKGCSRWKNTTDITYGIC
jgi:alpha-glucosidase